MSLLKIGGYAVAVTAIGSLLYTVGSFWFPHVAVTQETEKRSLENQAIVHELQEIKRAEFDQKQGEREIMEKLCKLGYVPERECVMAGVPYVKREHE